MDAQAVLVSLPTVKACTKCAQVLPLAGFFKSKNARDGHHGQCKKCYQQMVLRYAKTSKGRAVRNKTNANTRRRPYGRALMLWHAARTRAQKHGLEFTITLEWVRERVMRGHCELSGIPFDFSVIGIKSNGKPYAPSIDKIDAFRGYTPDNCRVICWAFNVAFGHWGEDAFVSMFKAYLAHKEGTQNND